MSQHKPVFKSLLDPDPRGQRFTLYVTNAHINRWIQKYPSVNIDQALDGMELGAVWNGKQALMIIENKLSDLNEGKIISMKERRGEA